MIELKKGFLYPKGFEEFGCFTSGELVVLCAESNSGKTTFACDIYEANKKMGYKGLYINLEFSLDIVYENKWLAKHGKSKVNLTNIAPLTSEELKDMDEYITSSLKDIDMLNKVEGIGLDELENKIRVAKVEGYSFFIIDTLSRIKGNLTEKSHYSQNETMEKMQELVQKLDIAIILLHHTNKNGTFEGSQKIMDLSNVFIEIHKDEDADGTQYRHYDLKKDKRIPNMTLDRIYHNGGYEVF